MPMLPGNLPHPLTLCARGPVSMSFLLRVLLAAPLLILAGVLMLRQRHGREWSDHLPAMLVGAGGLALLGDVAVVLLRDQGPLAVLPDVAVSAVGAWAARWRRRSGQTLPARKSWIFLACALALYGLCWWQMADVEVCATERGVATLEGDSVQQFGRESLLACTGTGNAHQSSEEDGGTCASLRAPKGWSRSHARGEGVPVALTVRATYRWGRLATASVQTIDGVRVWSLHLPYYGEEMCSPNQEGLPRYRFAARALGW